MWRAMAGAREGEEVKNARHSCIDNRLRDAVHTNPRDLVQQNAGVGGAARDAQWVARPYSFASLAPMALIPHRGLAAPAIFAGNARGRGRGGLEGNFFDVVGGKETQAGVDAAKPPPLLLQLRRILHPGCQPHQRQCQQPGSQ